MSRVGPFDPPGFALLGSLKGAGVELICDVRGCGWYVSLPPWVTLAEAIAAAAEHYPDHPRQKGASSSQ